MREPRWVDLKTLYLLHARQIERFGGTGGVRDAGVVESSLNRAQNRFHYGGDTVDLGDLAAYLYGFA